MSDEGLGEKDFHNFNLLSDGTALAENETCTVFVGNVPYKVTWSALKGFFSQFGNVGYVKIMRHVVTGRNQGAAFVRFESVEAADRAKDASKTELTFQGRILRVRETKPKQRRTHLPAGAENTTEKWEGSKNNAPILPESQQADEDNTLSFSILNDDCLIRILSFVEPFDRIKMERVNKTWRRCALMAAKRQKHLTVRKQGTHPFGYLRKVQICKLIKHCSAFLVSLDLSMVSKQVGKSSVETIARCCRKLERMDMSGSISVCNEGISKISARNPNIKWLKLDGCPRITEKGIWSVFRHCKQLEVLHCFGNIFLGKFFKWAPATLKEVHLRYCLSLTNEGISYLSQCPNLKCLDLNSCQLMSTDTIANIFKNCKCLEEINIGNFCMNPNNNAPMIRCLANPEIITKLTVDNTEMEDDDLLFVCTHCRQITELDVSCNPLTDVSVTQLSALSKLEVLHICHLFSITNSSLVDLVRVGNLKRLRMQGCKKVNDDLFEEMAKCCTRLEELDIAGVYDATSRTLAAFTLALQEQDRGKLYIYAFYNSFLDSGVEHHPGLSVCEIYRHLYSTHNNWVLQGDEEPYNIVIDRQWEPEELEQNLDEQLEAMLNPALYERPLGQALPADLVDVDDWDSDFDDFGDGEGFLMNDDPLEREIFDRS